MNKACLAAATSAAAKHIVIVRSSSVASGTVGRNVEVDDDDFFGVYSEKGLTNSECVSE